MQCLTSGSKYSNTENHSAARAIERTFRSFNTHSPKKFIRLQIGAGRFAVLTGEVVGPEKSIKLLDSTNFRTSRRAFARGSLLGKKPWLSMMQ